MKIDKTFKIKEKYFNAILRFEKPFELRHQEIPENSIVKLECENGRYLIFRSGRFSLYDNVNYCFQLKNNKREIDREFVFKEYEGYEYYGAVWFGHENEFYRDFDGYDNFCGEYINKAPTYLIEIAEILEVK